MGSSLKSPSQRDSKTKRRSRPILEVLEVRLQMTTTPASVTLAAGSPLAARQTQTLPLTITLPPSTVSTKVDIALLLDDTGSFTDFTGPVESIFTNLVNSLQAAMPGVDFGFGVARFEDYGGPGTVFSEDLPMGRPYILNQPIITAAAAAADGTNLNTLIATALGEQSQGHGGDIPEPVFEALYQIATGAGFDGNGNGSKLDSGPAGALATATTPGMSGDVPPFSSNLGLTVGSLGGIGWRPGAQHIVLLATDTAPVAAFSGSTIPTQITGLGGVTVPTSTVESTAGRVGFVSTTVYGFGTGPQPAVVPKGGATVQETVSALNAAGIEVIGLGPDAAATASYLSNSPSPVPFFNSIAKLTGAVDPHASQPIVFDTSVSSPDLTKAIVGSINPSQTQPISIGLTTTSLPAGLTFSVADPQVVTNVSPGGSATFSVTVSVASLPFNGSFDANFVNVASGEILGTVPFVIDLPMAPPTVAASLRTGVHHNPTMFVIRFDQPMDPVSVQNVNNYILLGQRSGRDPIISAIYDPATQTVTLRPKRHVNLHFDYFLQIVAQGPQAVSSATGIPLDGDYGGYPGIDFVGVVRRFAVTPSVPKPPPSHPKVTAASLTKKRHTVSKTAAHRLERPRATVKVAIGGVHQAHRLKHSNS
jgi:hypothetical protein